MDHFDDRASYTSDVSHQSEPMHRYSSKGFSTKATANKNPKRSKSVPRSTHQNSSSKSLPRSASASRNDGRARQQANRRSVHNEEHTEEEIAYINNNNSTLPAQQRRRLMEDSDDLPPASSTPVEPLSEAIVEEERKNPDG